MQEGKVVVWGGFANSLEKKRVKGKGEKENTPQLNEELKRIATTDKKDLDFLKNAKK